MYSFEDFQEQIISSVREKLIERYGKADLTIQRKMKNNCILTGVICDVVPSEKPEFRPTFYIEPLYQAYQEGVELEIINSKLYSQLVGAIADQDDITSWLSKLCEAKDRIAFHFIHTKQNEEWLKELPHREFNDLSIVYRWVIDINQPYDANALINNQSAECMGLTEPELYQLAYENTKRIFEPLVMPLKEYVKKVFVEEKKMVDMDVVEQFEDDTSLYMVSNRTNDKGAISILYTDELNKLAEQLNSDLYLIPVSVDEMIAAPVEISDLEEFLEKLHENTQAIPVEVRLSNEIYQYERSTQNIVLATDSGQTMLVDEPSSQGMEMEMC